MYWHHSKFTRKLEFRKRTESLSCCLQISDNTNRYDGNLTKFSDSNNSLCVTLNIRFISHCLTHINQFCEIGWSWFQKNIFFTHFHDHNTKCFENERHFCLRMIDVPSFHKRMFLSLRSRLCFHVKKTVNLKSF